MASTREKVVYILYYFAVINAFNTVGYIVGFHKEEGEEIEPIDYYYATLTSLNLVSDVLLLRTIYHPPPYLSKFAECVLVFLVFNAGTTFTSLLTRLLWCHHETRQAFVDLEKIPYNRDAATHRNILFMAYTFQFTVIFMFKVTLLSVVYTFYRELKEKTTRKREVACRDEPGDSGLHERARQVT